VETPLTCVPQYTFTVWHTSGKAPCKPKWFEREPYKIKMFVISQILINNHTLDTILVIWVQIKIQRNSITTTEINIVRFPRICCLAH